jgi:5'-3' exonuclease
MGIERFFNSIKETYNIIQNTEYPYIKIETDHVLFDFNSMIHSVSQKLKLEANTDAVNLVVINAVKKQLLSILKNNFNPNKIKTVYIGIDGVPSKAKMIEQKHRRYMGYYLALKKQATSKWSKNNISPGTKFMHEMGNSLASDEFKQEVSAVAPNMKAYVVSDIYEFGEGEMKIVDYINEHQLDNLTIYSPDADVILLGMLLHTKNTQILRFDQQTTERASRDNKGSERADNIVYNIIDVDKLSDTIIEYMSPKLKTINSDKTTRKRIINDIVFLFTIFGDDFLPKIESYNVKTDIEVLFDFYVEAKLKDDDYLLIKDDNTTIINRRFFAKLLKNMGAKEDDILLRNYYKTNFKNYNYLIKTIAMYIAKHETDYYEVNHHNIAKFITHYNVCRELDKIGDLTSITDNLHLFIKENINAIDVCNTIDEEVTCLNEKNNIIKLYKKYIDKVGKPPPINNYLKSDKDLRNYIRLQKFENTINNKYHQQYTKDMTSEQKEFYKMEKLLEPYGEKYSATKINIRSEQEKLTFYKKYFYKDDMDVIILEYLSGLKWMVDYYYNNKIHNNWTFKYTKSPLLKDVFNYLYINPEYKENELVHLDTFFTPLEQFLYVTPFNSDHPQKEYLDMLIGSRGKSAKAAEFVKTMGKYYFDMKMVVDSDVKCEGVSYLNKCHITKMSDYDVSKFIKKFRTYVSYDDQLKIFGI